MCFGYSSLSEPECWLETGREDNIKMDHKQGVGDVECIRLSKNEDQWRAVLNTVMNFPVAHERGSY
jgi:hypothetical protein